MAKPSSCSGRIAATLLLYCASIPANAQTVVTNERGDEWLQLFNGRDLTGWTPKISKHALGENLGNTFRVEDGLLKVRHDEYGKAFDRQLGHLFYQQPFSYYRLAVEYRFVAEQASGGPGAWALRNSGAMLHSQHPRTMTRDRDFPISIEAQFLGGAGDGESRPTLNVCSPDTDIVYQGSIYAEHCLASTSKTFDGDQWVRSIFAKWNCST